MGILETIRGSASGPIRRLLTVFVRNDPRTGKTVEIPIESRETLLSQDGSPDTITVRYAQFWDCQHSIDQPLGGQCLECCSLSCCACFGPCVRCHRPICLSCSYFEQVSEREQVRWCRTCYEADRRRRRWRKVGMALVQPFVELPDTRKS